MGVVEDVQSALQDFVAPELRALAVRIEKLEAEHKELRSEFKELRSEFKEFRAEVKTEFRELEEKSDRHYESLMTEIRRSALIHDLVERVARLEAERRASQ